MKGNVIGYLNLDARENVRRHFEYAGAGETWNLYAAQVPVVTGDYFAVYAQPGERIDSWFQNRIGACYGSDNRDTNVVPGEYHHQTSYFQLAKYVMEDRMTLTDEWYVHVYDDTYEDGTPVARVMKK